MKVNYFSLVFILLLVFSCSRSQGQCAFDYAGSYGGRTCAQPDEASSYYPVEILALDSNSILIRNFKNYSNDIICDVEDTIVVNLDCALATLECQFVSYDLCVVSAELGYEGDGTLYTDSLMISYTQLNPDGVQGLCRVYKRDAYVGISEINEPRLITAYPNPTEDRVSLGDILLPKGTNARVFNYQGRLVKSALVVDNSIDLSGLPDGVYFIESKDSQDKVVRGTVMKVSG